MLLQMDQMELDIASRSANPSRAAAPTGKSHCEAERRRRQRINGHLATLRTLLPSTNKMDKATLLTEVVRQVRELRGLVAEGGAVLGFPGERDEVVVEEGDAKKVRAWVCCEDRPGLMGELSRAIASVRAKAVRAEITTVGGRTRSVLDLELFEDSPAATAVERRHEKAAVKAALGAILEEKVARPVGLVPEKYKRAPFSNRCNKVLL